MPKTPKKKPPAPPKTLDLAALEEALLDLPHSMMIEWVDGENDDGDTFAGLRVAARPKRKRETPYPAAVCWEDGDLVLEVAEGDDRELETFLPPGDAPRIAARMWAALTTLKGGA